MAEFDILEEVRLRNLNYNWFHTHRGLVHQKSVVEGCGVDMACAMLANENSLVNWAADYTVFTAFLNDIGPAHWLTYFTEV